MSGAKINAVDICLADEVCGWYAELQPLADKTGPTICHAAASILRDFFNPIQVSDNRIWHKLRVVHLLTGDGINTNENVAKRLLAYFRSHNVFQIRSVDYNLVSLRCASHAVYRAMQVAMCGDILPKASHTDEVCANATRLFKYILPDYNEVSHVGPGCQLYICVCLLICEWAFVFVRLGMRLCRFCLCTCVCWF